MDLVSFVLGQVCVAYGASRRLAGQEEAMLCALDPPVSGGVALRIQGFELGAAVKSTSICLTGHAIARAKKKGFT